VFMQEFVEVKRRLGSAPPCTFSQHAPLELKEFPASASSSFSTSPSLGYISFAVLKNHLEGGKKEKVVAVLQSFRSYLQYHIKCSKSYFHARMRARVVSMLKVLSRARQERIEEKEKKTASGKTFVRS
jgi:actin related protein 2/3 complex subunit 2